MLPLRRKVTRQYDCDHRPAHRAGQANQPKRAGIDPYDKIIDRERGDNMLAVSFQNR
jgi:hypothetical protein